MCLSTHPYYYSTAKADDVYDDVDGQPQGLTGNDFKSRGSKHGWWVVAQQQVTSHNGDASRGLSLFANLTVHDKATNVVDNYQQLGDIRGFSMRFYTEQGNWDLVGNNTPVFYLRDPLKFPDLNHVVKRDPRTNLRNATFKWDFFSHLPESLHQLTIDFSDRGLGRCSW